MIDARGRLFVVFDLDLYAPTAFALEWVTPKLKPGDLLYFDEAYDPWHERQALDEFLALVTGYERWDRPGSRCCSSIEAVARGSARRGATHRMLRRFARRWGCDWGRT
jgi:hypothetical protein